MRQGFRTSSIAAGSVVLVLAGLAMPAVTSAAPSGQKAGFMYNSVPTPLHGNMPSLGAEAYSFTELGDGVTFAAGSNRALKAVTVTMSSWGCDSGTWNSGDCVTPVGATFSEAVTFNIYDENGANLIATATQTFAIPYRPSASPKCTDTNAGKWWDSSQKTCYNGLATNITFTDFVYTGSAAPLPDKVVYGIAYNTTHNGDTPIGESADCYATSGGCGYDALNIGLAPAVSVGSQTVPDTIWWDSTYAPNYCDYDTIINPDVVVGVFRLDSASNPCWTGYIPAVQFKGGN